MADPYHAGIKSGKYAKGLTRGCGQVPVVAGVPLVGNLMGLVESTLVSLSGGCHSGRFSTNDPVAVGQ